jgi:DhnA family fructose-bisphosphate aldolase class Ia
MIIPESWTKMTTWVEEIQFVVMEIIKGKPNQVWCTIGRIKQHHEDYKHESFYLTSGLLLDITCNPKHELELAS